MHPLSNVSLCVQDPSHIITANITYFNQTNIVSFNRQSALPEKVYLVCGDQAYSCFPRESHSRYIAFFFVPLIREVSAAELSSLHRRARRTIATTKRVVGLLIASYGVSTSQKEIQSLSTVLEHHMNLSTTAITATSRRLDDVACVATGKQNGLGPFAASQGSVCQVIHTECYSYIASNDTEITKLKQNTEQGIKVLHDVHGWDPFSKVFGPLSSIGTSFFRTLIVSIVMFLIAISFITCMIGLIRKQCTKAIVTAMQIGLYPIPDWIPPI